MILEIGSGVKLYRCVFAFLRVYLVDMVDLHGRSEFQGRGIQLSDIIIGRFYYTRKS